MKILLTLLLLAPFAQAKDKAELEALYKQHRWFELRDAIQGQNAAPLYKGAVAVAFNKSKSAEYYLRQAIKLETNSDHVEDAYGMLANLYARFGEYRKATQQLDQMLKIRPGDQDTANTHALFGAWAGHPDQSTKQLRPTRIHAD